MKNLILTKKKKEEDFHRERESTHIEHAVHVRIFHFQTIISGGYMGADLFERSAYVVSRERKKKKRRAMSTMTAASSSWRIRRRRREKKGEGRREKSYFAAPLRVFI